MIGYFMKEAAKYEMVAKATIKPTNNNMKRPKVPLFSELSFVPIVFVFKNYTVPMVESKGTTID